MEKIVAIFERTAETGEDASNHLPKIERSIGPLVRGLTANMAGSAFRHDLLKVQGDAGQRMLDLYDSRLYGALSLWIDRLEDAPAIHDALAFMPGRRTLYSVVESVPREYGTIDWAVGAPSPGATLLAIFRKNPALSTDEFIARWMAHSVHSLKIHPLSRYHRNLVVRRIAGEGDDLDGIVEERVGSIADLAPERFYIGGAEAQTWAAADIATFIDVQSSMRCNLTEEIISKLPPWLEPLRAAAASGR